MHAINVAYLVVWIDPFINGCISRSAYRFQSGLPVLIAMRPSSNWAISAAILLSTISSSLTASKCPHKLYTAFTPPQKWGFMMTSSNGNIFRVTGHLCGESPHKGQWCGAVVFSLICVWINGWVNNREAGDLRRYPANYNVSVMILVLVCSTSLMASLIRSVGGLSKCYYQGLWLAVLSADVIGQSINRRGVA